MIYAPVSIAPMMDKTDRHFRYFLRQLSKQVLLYTEMITPSAIIHGDRNRLLDFDPIEHPIALQLGGDNPDELAEAVKIAEDWNYDEYNLNVGCPSDRVQHRQFGACLMVKPDHVAVLLEAMYRAGTKPVSIKQRIGIEGKGVNLGKYEDLAFFVETLQDGPSSRYIVHARIAVLEGLSPKENRQIPPLRYEDVYRLKEEYPHLHIEINGGIRNYTEICRHLQYSDGVMLGRLAYERPWCLAEIDSRYYSKHNPAGQESQITDILNPTRREVITTWFSYMRKWIDRGVNLRSLTWPLLEIFAKKPGSRKWKQALSRNIPCAMDIDSFFAEALDKAPAEYLDIPAYQPALR